MAAERNARERYRAHVIEEIKRHAWEQIATAGVTALSLNAIAKLVGMSGPGLYRYFASRDDLITALIRDAYRSLADAVTTEFESGSDVVGLAHVVRNWALEDPQRYFLIYGTPVPGYHAPADTTEIADEIMMVLIKAFSAVSPELPSSAPSATPFDIHLQTHRRDSDDGTADAPTLRRCITFQTRLHGVISLELAGQFQGMGFDPVVLFDNEVATLTR